jgi:hypothetical protein
MTPHFDATIRAGDVITIAVMVIGAWRWLRPLLHKLTSVPARLTHLEERVDDHESRIGVLEHL